MRYFFLFLILAAPAGGAELALTLRAAEESALAVSNQYRGARLSAEAAAAAARASKSYGRRCSLTRG